MTPLAIDQWGWTKEDAIMYLGITMACGGLLSGLCFATIGPLSKKFDERLLLICAGLFPMILGRVCMFPLGSEYLEPGGDKGEQVVKGKKLFTLLSRIRMTTILTLAFFVDKKKKVFSPSC